MSGKTYHSIQNFSNFDFGGNGVYFVTITTYDLRYYFGEILNHRMYYTEIGEIVHREMALTHEYKLNSGIDIVNYVVMPNHVHILFKIKKDISSQVRQVEKFGKPTKDTIPTIVRNFKSAVSYNVHHNTSYSHLRVWQDGYNVDLIGNQNDYFRVVEYIKNNHIMWDNDCYR